MGRKLGTSTPRRMSVVLNSLATKGFVNMDEPESIRYYSLLNGIPIEKEVPVLILGQSADAEL